MYIEKKCSQIKILLKKPGYIYRNKCSRIEIVL